MSMESCLYFTLKNCWAITLKGLWSTPNCPRPLTGVWTRRLLSDVHAVSYASDQRASVPNAWSAAETGACVSQRVFENSERKRYQGGTQWSARAIRARNGLLRYGGSAQAVLHHYRRVSRTKTPAQQAQMPLNVRFKYCECIMLTLFPYRLVPLLYQAVQAAQGILHEGSQFVLGLSTSQ